MVWVGSGGDKRTEVNDHNEGVWLPDSSVSNSMTVDFDLLVKNIKVWLSKTVGLSPWSPWTLCLQSLNILAGEGSTSVTSTPRGAKLKACTYTHTHQINLSLLHSQCVEAVPLTLYANGIVMFQGPFRPFTDPSTQVHYTVQ